MAIPIRVLMVCMDCVQIREHDEIHHEPDRKPWGLINPTRYSVTLGILSKEHEDNCYPETRDYFGTCDCTHDAYSTSSCDACGSTLHGEREAYTLWDKSN